MFDTAGFVMTQGQAKFPIATFWKDLSPFEQGYIEAAMESFCAELAKNYQTVAFGCSALPTIRQTRRTKMTRIEAGQMINLIVDQFSADDVKLWLTDKCRQNSSWCLQSNNKWESDEWLALASFLAKVPNLGI